MDRCALFVDAGYALADGAMAVHGTRRRDSVSWDHAGLVKFLSGLARDRTGLPVLRCYWYEAAADGSRTAEHDALADLTGLKLRLVNVRPGRREGIETQLRRDLVTLAKNGAISDAFVASADENLAEIVAEVQDLGLRVVILHIASDGGWTVPQSLRQESDDLVEISGVHLRPFVDLIRGAEPANADDLYPGAAFGSRSLADGSAQVAGAMTHQGRPAAALPAPGASYPAPVAAEYRPGAQQYAEAGQAQPNSQNAEYRPGAQQYAEAGQAQPNSQTSYPGGNGTSQPGGQPGQPAQQQNGAAQGGSMPGRPAQSGYASGVTGAAAQNGAQQGGYPNGTAQSGMPADSYPGGMSHHGPAFSGPAYSGSLHSPPASAGPALTGSGPAGPGPAGPAQAGSAPAGSVPAGSAPGTPGSGAPAHGGPTFSPTPQGGPAQNGPPQGGGYQSGTAANGAAQSGAAAQSGLPPSGYQNGPVQNGNLPGSYPGGVGQSQNSAVQNGAPQNGYAQGGAQQGSYQNGWPQIGARQGGGYQSAAPSAPQPGDLYGGSYGAGPPAAPPAGFDAAPTPGQHQQLYGAPDSGYFQDQPAATGADQGPRVPFGQQQPAPVAGSAFPAQAQYSAQPQPVAQLPAVRAMQAVAVSLPEAVKAAHAEGFGFGESVGRDAPALWLDAVLARKPRMPSDLEARLLQGSALPIDSLLHDEVRHSLRRGFWDALESARR